MKKNKMGENIKALREAYGLTQQQFANKANTAALTIGNIERGQTQTLQPESLQTIVKAFGTTMEWLKEGKGEMLPQGKIEIETSDNNPLRDFALQGLRKENDGLWQLIQDFRSGKLNFLTPVRQTGT